ncbi:MAG: hypothetical protein ACK5LC_09955 [Coprobacillaceae bacterium]
MKKQIINIILLTLCLNIFTGCSASNEEEITYIKEHFQTNEEVTYEEPMVSLDKDHVFSFDISSKAINKLEKDGYSKSAMFSVYVDPELTQPIQTKYKVEDETLKISVTDSLSHFRHEYERQEISKDDEWSIFNHYYLVQSFDLETGKKLNKPKVTVFTIEYPLDAPSTKIIYEEDNSFTIAWDAVENATEYYLMRVDFNYNDTTVINVIDATKDTSWNSKKDGKDIEEVDAELFRSYSFSEDEQYTMDSENWWEMIKSFL